MRLFRYMAILLHIFLLSCCTSNPKRVQCEQTNWNHYGYVLAESGKHLDSDDFLSQCKKADANINSGELEAGFKAWTDKNCNTENVYELGKSGHRLANEVCDDESKLKMKTEYNKGLEIFCRPANAGAFAANGGVYENVCPQDKEKQWLVEYRKTRKVYLTSAVREKEKIVQQLSEALASYEKERKTLAVEQGVLDRDVHVTKKMEVGPSKNKTTQTSKGEIDGETRTRIAELTTEISNLNWKIEGDRKKQNDLNEQLVIDRSELGTL